MKYRVAISIALLSLASFTVQAKYDGEDRGKPVMPSTVNAKFLQECAACHMAFPPGLLTAASWKKLMTGLDKHFDVDASVTPAEATIITDFLVKNASNRWTATTAPLRITDSVWFKTKHSSSEIAPAVWKRASIKSASNCMACHIGSEKGDFNEHNIKIPK